MLISFLDGVLGLIQAFANTVWWNVLGTLLFVALLVVMVRNLLDVDREICEQETGERPAAHVLDPIIIWKVM